MRARNVTPCRNGFSLVEVMIAMAILGSVLLSIVTLFFLGRANVYSGKQLTRATAATVHANEDVQSMAPRDLFNAFGPIVPATALGTNTVAGVSYANSLVYTTAQAGSTADAKGYLTRWANLLPAANILNGKVSIIIMPLDLVTVGDVTTAKLVQVRLVTEWQEGPRYRNVVVDSSKLNRF